MYVPSAFREERVQVMHALIRTHPLATLVTAGRGGLQANLLPFTLDEESGLGILRAHMAKANEQFAALLAGAEVLVIFQGPQAYITPSWYASAQQHGRVVPTWNYVVVQARGKPRVIEHPAWLLSQVERITQAQERPRKNPWNVTDAPDDFIQKQLQAIAGIEIPISHLAGKWKVSQNRSQADRDAVARGLRDEGNSAMAELVESIDESR